MLPIDIAVSLDAATAETYESIRVGSSWENVQSNLDRFRDHAQRRDAHVSVTYCLMTVNWHEFADFCLMADANGFSCDVNTVTQPSHLSLYHLPVAELEPIVAGLREVDRQRRDDFGWSRPTWTGELDRLERHLADRRSGTAVTGVDVHEESPVLVKPFGDRDGEVAEASSTPRGQAQSMETPASTGRAGRGRGSQGSGDGSARSGSFGGRVRGDGRRTGAGPGPGDPGRSSGGGADRRPLHPRGPGQLGGHRDRETAIVRRLRIRFDDGRVLLVRSEPVDTGGTTVLLAWSPQGD